MVHFKTGHLTQFLHFFFFLAGGHDQSDRIKSHESLILSSWGATACTFAGTTSFPKMPFLSFLWQAPANVSRFTRASSLPWNRFQDRPPFPASGNKWQFSLLCPTSYHFWNAPAMSLHLLVCRHVYSAWALPSRASNSISLTPPTASSIYFEHSRYLRSPVEQIDKCLCL